RENRLANPKKMRKRSQAEPPAGVKMGRTGMKMTCKRYGGPGHNKRSYSSSNPQKQTTRPSNPSQDNLNDSKIQDSLLIRSTKIRRGHLYLLMEMLKKQQRENLLL
ncbi:Hypothetical predicted protein, partial [Olea europaea subsp. europaea]